MFFLENPTKIIWTPSEKRYTARSSLKLHVWEDQLKFMQDKYFRRWGAHYFGFGYEWPREAWVETPKNTNREHHDRSAVLGTIEGSSNFAYSCLDICLWEYQMLQAHWS
jgi:hypothetical protein